MLKSFNKKRLQINKIIQTKSKNSPVCMTMFESYSSSSENSYTCHVKSHFI